MGTQARRKMIAGEVWVNAHDLAAWARRGRAVSPEGRAVLEELQRTLDGLTRRPLDNDRTDRAVQADPISA